MHDGQKYRKQTLTATEKTKHHEKTKNRKMQLLPGHSQLCNYKSGKPEASIQHLDRCSAQKQRWVVVQVCRQYLITAQADLK